MSPFKRDYVAFAMANLRFVKIDAAIEGTKSSLSFPHQQSLCFTGFHSILRRKEAIFCVNERRKKP